MIFWLILDDFLCNLYMHMSITITLILICKKENRNILFLLCYMICKKENRNILFLLCYMILGTNCFLIILSFVWPHSVRVSFYVYIVIIMYNF